MSEPDEPHIKITMTMMYAEQQQTNRMLAQAVAHLENLADIPERMRAVELENATQRTAIKELKEAQRIAVSALIAAGLAIITQIANWMMP